MTKIFAHRGASGYAPENTMPAFELAVEQGADGIELDVQMTRDGELVVIHDETINRTSNGDGWVKDYTLKELREISFDNGMTEYQGVQIPLLKEVLGYLQGKETCVNIELKTGIYWYPDIEEKTLELVAENGMEKRVLYSSFNHYSVQKIRALNPEAETAYLYSDVILDVEKYAARTHVDGIHPALYHIKMGDFAKKYQESGLKVRIWTVNEAEDLKKLMEEGWEAVITNYPDRAVQVRDGIQR